MEEQILRLNNGEIYTLPIGITGAWIGLLEQKLPLHQHLIILTRDFKEARYQKALKYYGLKHQEAYAIKMLYIY
jgi:hypothetical protein